MKSLLYSCAEQSVQKFARPISASLRLDNETSLEGRPLATLCLIWPAEDLKYFDDKENNL